MKLKLGSQRNLNSPSNEAGEVDTEESELMKMEDDSTSATSSQEGLKVVSSFHEEVTAVDTDCYSQRMQPSSIDSHSMGSSKRQNKSSVSVLYLFSKFRSAQNAVSSLSGDADEIENGSSVSNSSSFSSCFSDSTEEQLELEFVSSLPVSPMYSSEVP